MPNLSSIKDTTALKQRYVNKVIVYVESDSDANLFRTIVGTKFHEYIQFETPPEKGEGCGPAKSFVAQYRKDNSRIYALLDGEAAVAENNGFEEFVKSDGAIFALKDPDGVLFLADHEAENILFRQADVIAYIAEQATLAEIGKKDPEEILLKVSSIIERQFAGALCKYASYRLHADGKISGVLSGTHAEHKPVDEIVKLLEQRVAACQCDWATFEAELERVRTHIVLHLETMDEHGKTTTKWRLADGKIALSQIRHAYKIAQTWEGPLAKQVAASPYAERFRQDLFKLTEIHVAA